MPPPRLCRAVGHAGVAVAPDGGAEGMRRWRVMSILRCDDCERFIDTDENVESYNEKDDRWRCWLCREKLPEDKE